MSLNRDEKDFLTQIGAAIVQSNNKLIASLKHQNEAHIAEMKKISGLSEVLASLDQINAHLSELESQTIIDRLLNVFRSRTPKAQKINIIGDVKAADSLVRSGFDIRTLPVPGDPMVQRDSLA